MILNYYTQLFIFTLLFLHAVSGERRFNDKDLDTWDPPEKLKRSLPCYFTGVDYDGQPVFVFEYGKWRIRPIVETGSEHDKNELDKYAEYLGYQWLKIAREFNNGTRGSYGLIMDLDGYDLEEFGNLPTLTFALRYFALRFAQEFSEDVDWGIVVNVNFIAQRLVDLVRPVLGANFAKLEFFGTNKNLWATKLLRKMPRENLPEWYGGSENFKPIKVFG